MMLNSELAVTIQQRVFGDMVDISDIVCSICNGSQKSQQNVVAHSARKVLRTRQRALFPAL